LDALDVMTQHGVWHHVACVQGPWTCLDVPGRAWTCLLAHPQMDSIRVGFCLDWNP